MQTRQLEYALEIARCGNLSGAAKNLGISQPALSQYLKGLEKQMGFPLFFSYQKRMLPTPEGAVYLNAAKRILEVRNHTYQRLQAYVNKKAERVIVGASGYTASRKLGQLIPLLYRKFPHTEVFIREGVSGELKQYLRQGKVNLAIVSYGENEEKPGSFFQFASEEMFVAVPKLYHFSPTASNGSGQREVIRLEELKEIPFIMPGERTGHRNMVEELFKKAGYSPAAVYTTENLMASLSMIAAGFGACFLGGHLMDHPELSECTVYSLSDRPRMVYGIEAREESGLNETEKFLIGAFLKRQLEEQNACFNEMSAVFMKKWEADNGYQTY